MIKLLGYLTIFCSFSTYALLPVEGILMGEVTPEIQTDPLASIFTGVYDTSSESETHKIKLYQASFEAGQSLSESCGYLGNPAYSTSWDQKQARRSIVATLQYIGLDTSIKAIGAYAKKMEIGEEEFKRLSSNVVSNYCSKNITVYSIRNIVKNLDYYYKNPISQMIPSVVNSPFATEMVKKSTETSEARSKEFDLVLKNFRAFCSWGGETEDYRLLTPYLRNKFIMSFVFKNMQGLQDQVDQKIKKVSVKPSTSTVQVLCDGVICRKESLGVFSQKFPLSAGATGIGTDLAKNYCHHFRFQDFPQKTIPQIKAWIKEQELEDPIFETSQFISLMTGVPDLLIGADAYQDVPFLIKSSIDERWTRWSKNVLGLFSKDLLYEESLNVKVEPRRDLSAIAMEGLRVHFGITMGEMDRILPEQDKISLTFDLKLSKNYLRSLRVKWAILEKEVDDQGKKEFRDEVSRYLDFQLKTKQKLFNQKMWNDDFSRLIAEELVQQVIRYKGPLFNSYQEEMINVPVKFSYGLFALSYIRYRADIGAGRVKMNL